MSSRLAEAWARALCAYWLEAQDRGQFDANHPAIVLDLEPAGGAGVWQLINELIGRQETTGEQEMPFLYVACVANPDEASALRSHPRLASLAKQGLLTFATWDFSGHPEIMGKPGALRNMLARNPVAILAHYVWGRLTRHIAGVHYGQLLAASEPRGAAGTSEWVPLDRTSWDARVVRVLESYARGINSGAIPVPVGAMRALDSLARYASRGWMALSRGVGFTAVSDLRLDGNRCFDSTELINFELLQRVYTSLHTECWTAPSVDGCANQVILHHPRSADTWIDPVIVSLNDSLDDTPAVLESARMLGARMSLDARIAMLRYSRFDPRMFAIVDQGDLTERLRGENESSRALWRESLRRVYRNYFPGQSSGRLYRSLARVAGSVSDWGLAKRALRLGMSAHGRNTTDLCDLAWCEVMSGKAESGLRLASHAVAGDPACGSAKAMLSRLRDEVRDWDGTWHCRIGDLKTGLALEPLGQRHAESLLRQYRDPQIGIMTGLPALGTLGEVKEWIAKNESEPGRHVYAVLHEDRGFVGAVCLAVAGPDAYLYFWIGSDFQGHGYARIAARLACELAKRRGLEVVFTSTFADNVRSQRVLRGIGFAQLEIRAHPPHDNVFFHALDMAVDLPKTPHDRLVSICKALGSTFDIERKAGNADQSWRDVSIPRCAV
jgi:RimJ/RimL family protein N-acetyltransferase